ncbi:MAG: type II toxin-antitoxin system Phd/YefM family antitoxin [Chloroflexia bacterium]|nr:type II toxin-antitoxin system Phd/YefM family antitoxin [Chloroflexia bacterium]
MTSDELEIELEKEAVMPRNVSTTEAKNQLSAMMRAVEENGDEVVVEDHGRPRVAIISMRGYEELKAWREQQRRQRALADLRALQKRVGERNSDLTSEQAEALADRFVREVVEEMFAEGKLRYEDE